MLTRADVEKLGTVHVVQPAVLSLYLTVPPHPAELGGLLVRAAELVAAAGTDSRRVRDRDENWVRKTLATRGRDWLGRTVAIFACTDADLLEALPLPCPVPERAVLGTRPHIRPLLVALQRCPAYRVVVVDEQHAWLYSVAGDEPERAPGPVAGTEPDPGFRDTAALLEQVVRHGDQEPLVIGGRDDDTQRLLASLPPVVRDCFAGSFTAEAHALSPARVHDLAAPVIARWTDSRAQCLADQIRAMLPCGLAAIGLPACLSAVNADAVETLVVPDEGLVPGYECGRCGALSTRPDSCPDWGAAPLPVPDVIEEMVTRTLEDGGQVSVIHGRPPQIVAKLYFPLAQVVPSGVPLAP
jgi:hypothetical protein